MYLRLYVVEGGDGCEELRRERVGRSDARRAGGWRRRVVG